MKKVILTAVALATIGFSQAQDKDSNKVSFGAKAGLNVSSINVKETTLSEYNSLMGLHVGGFVNIPLADKFSFQPELLYSMQGGKEERNIVNNYSSTNTLKNTYLNLPLMVQYKIIDKLFVEAGPQVGFFLGNTSEYEMHVYSNNTTVSSSDDRSDYYNSIDVGLNVGAGYFVTDNIFVNVRYNLGLSKVFTDDLNLDANNSVFQLSVGYKF